MNKEKDSTKLQCRLKRGEFRTYYEKIQCVYFIELHFISLQISWEKKATHLFYKNLHDRNQDGEDIESATEAGSSMEVEEGVDQAGSSVDTDEEDFFDTYYTNSDDEDEDED